MKVRQTLFFMLWNPGLLSFYFWVCLILLSASITMSDDPFIYGTLPDTLETARGSFENFPWSIWKLVAALFIIIDEVVRDFSFHPWAIAILPTLVFGYREARSSLKGIATERQMWMQWYDRQQLIRTQEVTYEIPPLSEYTPEGPYFIAARKTVTLMLQDLRLLVGYFVCWIFACTLLALPISFNINDFMWSLLEIVIPAAIFTFILSYREARGNLKGAALEKHIWAKWYYQQIGAITQGHILKEPPSNNGGSLEDLEAYYSSEEISATWNFMRCNLKPFIVHLVCWILASVPLFFTTLSPEDTPEDIFEIFDLVTRFGYILPLIVIIVLFISYREARGNLKGIVKTQRVWMQWYHRRQETIRNGNTFEEPPPLENTQKNSYFRTAQKALQFMVRHPMCLIVQLTCWLSVCIFLYDESIHLQPILFVTIIALIFSYQEARGTIKGTAKETEVWVKWWQRQTEAEAQNYTLAEVPPAMNEMADNHST